MITRVRGRYDGSVVLLDEPAMIPAETPVTVEFQIPEVPASDSQYGENRPFYPFHWRTERLPGDTWEGNLSDEVIRERREE